MFPEHGMDISILSPLSWASVIHELLLPEVVICLIQEDLRLSRTECTAIFRESSKTHVLPAHSLELHQEIKQEPIPIDPALLTPGRVSYINLTTPSWGPVKTEELPVTLNDIGLGSDVIDLTLDSDLDS